MSLIEESTPLCETYLDAIASGSRVKLPPNGGISGCLYDSKGAVIPLSQRFGGYYGDFFPNADTEAIATDNLHVLPVLKGRSVYLGHFMPHYGHFLVEMLSSFWIYNTFSSFDHFVFHPFVFGDEIPSYIRDVFQAFGISLSKVRLIRTQTILADVTIPERLVKLNKSAKTEVRNVYGFLANTFDRSHDMTAHHRYYISRVLMSLKHGQRVVINEPLIEDICGRMGFTTIYPELMSFAEQVSLFHQADVIIGLSGSALHNCVFMRANTLLIEIADLRSPNQTHPMQEVCNRLSNITHCFIPFSGYVLNKDKQLGIIRHGPLISQILFILRIHQLGQDSLPSSLTSSTSLKFKRYYINMLLITLTILRLSKWWLMRCLSKSGAALQRSRLKKVRII